MIGKSEREGPDGPQRWYRVVPPSGEYRWVRREQVVDSSEKLVEAARLAQQKNTQQAKANAAPLWATVTSNAPATPIQHPTHRPAAKASAARGVAARRGWPFRMVPQRWRQHRFRRQYQVRNQATTGKRTTIAWRSKIFPPIQPMRLLINQTVSNRRISRRRASSSSVDPNYWRSVADQVRRSKRLLPVMATG